jgi:hypothetical protein
MEKMEFMTIQTKCYSHEDLPMRNVTSKDSFKNLTLGTYTLYRIP